MCGYRPLTKSEKAEQSATNKAGYFWIVISTILGIILFFSVSYMAGLVTGPILVLFCMTGLDYSDMTETDCGTCGE